MMTAFRLVLSIHFEERKLPKNKDREDPKYIPCSLPIVNIILSNVESLFLNGL